MSEPLSNEESTLLPLKTLTCIEHLLRLYWSPAPFDMDTQAIKWLRFNELIVPSSLTETKWRVTDRGKAYVEAIRNLPLPVQVTEWRIP